MAVKLRLKRLGRKKKPVYRLVAIESSKPRDGRVIEELGFYDPQQEPVEFRCKEDRIKDWLSKGAIPSQTVDRLLSSQKLTERYVPKSSQLGVAKKDRKSDSED